MTIAKSLTGYTLTLDPQIVSVYDAINTFDAAIQSQLTSQEKTAAIYAFEDAINPLSGIIEQQSVDVRNDIVARLSVSKSLAGQYGYIVQLNLLDFVSISYTGPISTEYAGIDTNTSTATITIEPYFPINANLLPVATNAALANTFQDGLAYISYNPLADVINSTKNTIFYYTEINYANLNSFLSTIAADGSLTAYYAYFKDKIGGGDGLSGAVAQLDSFKEHTDRLSGLKLESGNEFASQTDDTTFEQYFYYNLPVGTPTIIGSFSAKYYRSAKYQIQATSGSEHQLTDYMVIHDNNLAYARVVDDVYTRDPYVTYSGVLSAGKVNIYANTTIANTDLVVYGTKIQIAKDSSSPEKMTQFKILDSHSMLSAYYNDGVDYVSLQTGSLSRSNTVSELAREFTDALGILSSASFSGLTTGAKQALLISLADAINSRSESLQASIDADYYQYQLAEKKVQALRILNQLSTNYDGYAKTLIDQTTLDTVKEYL